MKREQFVHLATGDVKYVRDMTRKEYLSTLGMVPSPLENDNEDEKGLQTQTNIAQDGKGDWFDKEEFYRTHAGPILYFVVRGEIQNGRNRISAIPMTLGQGKRRGIVISTHNAFCYENNEPGYYVRREVHNMEWYWETAYKIEKKYDTTKHAQRRNKMSLEATLVQAVLSAHSTAHNKELSTDTANLIRTLIGRVVFTETEYSDAIQRCVTVLDLAATEMRRVADAFAHVGCFKAPKTPKEKKETLKAKETMPTKNLMGARTIQADLPIGACVIEFDSYTAQFCVYDASGNEIKSGCTNYEYLED